MSDVVKRKELKDSSEISIIDQSNPHSVYNMSPDNVKKCIDQVPANVWDMSVYELANQAEIGIDEKKLRIAFWIEYERAVRNNTPINLYHVGRGIIQTRGMNTKIMANPYKLAYILTPPEDYRVKLEEMLIIALDEERKVLELPVVQRRIQITKDGKEIIHEKVDTKLAALKHQIRESLQNRVHGAVATKSFNINKQIDDEKEELSKSSVEELQKIVEELKQEKEAVVINPEALKDDE